MRLLTGTFLLLALAGMAIFQAATLGQNGDIAGEKHDTRYRYLLIKDSYAGQVIVRRQYGYAADDEFLFIREKHGVKGEEWIKSDRGNISQFMGVSESSRYLDAAVRDNLAARLFLVNNTVLMEVYRHDPNSNRWREIEGSWGLVCGSMEVRNGALQLTRDESFGKSILVGSISIEDGIVCADLSTHGKSVHGEQASSTDTFHRRFVIDANRVGAIWKELKN